jgi:hypothetical protein
LRTAEAAQKCVAIYLRVSRPARRLEDTDADKVAAIVAARAAGNGVRRIAGDLGVGVGTVLRVTGEGV